MRSRSTNSLRASLRWSVSPFCTRGNTSRLSWWWWKRRGSLAKNPQLLQRRFSKRRTAMLSVLFCHSSPPPPSDRLRLHRKSVARIAEVDQCGHVSKQDTGPTTVRRGKIELRYSVSTACLTLIENFRGLGVVSRHRTAETAMHCNKIS